MKNSPDPQQFTAAFSSRLHSMAAAHDVLTANDWRGAELCALMQHLLANYLNSQRVNLEGASVHLPLDYIAPFSLIITELLTNAVKYGALSTSDGRVDVRWEVETVGRPKPVVALTWTETGGPRPYDIGATGFGMTLIKRSLADANVSVDFKPEGLVCHLSWPVGPPR